MKILALCKEHKGLHHLSGKDYLQNALLHGLRSLYGNQVIDFPKCETIYFDFHDQRKFIHGQGFTVGAILPDIKIDRTEIEQKILNNYFDIIIYLTVEHLPFIELVLKCYSPNKIIFCDGRDFNGIEWNLVDKGIYFKRELIENHEKLFPITYSFPSEKICFNPVVKSQHFSQSAPNGGIEIFNYPMPPSGHGYHKSREFNYVAVNKTEHEYYAEYQKSIFGITCKKGGWDCMRHYEIVFNRCIPYFVDINDCPPKCLFNWDKNLLKSVLQLKGVQYKSIDFNQNSKLEYQLNEISNEIFSKSLQHHTTIASVEYILTHI